MPYTQGNARVAFPDNNDPVTTTLWQAGETAATLSEEWESSGTETHSTTMGWMGKHSSANEQSKRENGRLRERKTALSPMPRFFNGAVYRSLSCSCHHQKIEQRKSGEIRVSNFLIVGAPTYTAFLEHFVPGKIELLIPKFAYQKRQCRFFQLIRIPRLLWVSRSDIRTFSIWTFHITCPAFIWHVSVIALLIISGNSLIRRQFTFPLVKNIFFASLSCPSEIALSHFNICYETRLPFSRGPIAFWDRYRGSAQSSASAQFLASSEFTASNSAPHPPDSSHSPNSRLPQPPRMLRTRRMRPIARILRTLRGRLTFFIRLISPLMIRSLIPPLINEWIITSPN
jgi:hypothetical protein